MGLQLAAFPLRHDPKYYSILYKISYNPGINFWQEISNGTCEAFHGKSECGSYPKMQCRKYYKEERLERGRPLGIMMP